MVSLKKKSVQKSKNSYFWKNPYKWEHCTVNMCVLLFFLMLPSFSVWNFPLESYFTISKKWTIAVFTMNPSINYRQLNNFKEIFNEKSVCAILQSRQFFFICTLFFIKSLFSFLMVHRFLSLTFARYFSFCRRPCSFYKAENFVLTFLLISKQCLISNFFDPQTSLMHFKVGRFIFIYSIFFISSSVLIKRKNNNLSSKWNNKFSYD